MAKQNRFADKAAKQVEVAGRKLRTNNPEHVRNMVDAAEQRVEREQRLLTEFSDIRGATWAAIRLKGLS